jgi:polysaccharide pyruvyl transferase WcaK-like protein
VGALILRGALRGAHIIVRDDDSVDLLNRWSLPHSRAPDLAFAWADTAGDCEKRTGNVMTIGLTARAIGKASQQAAYENAMVVAVNNLMHNLREEDREARLVLFPQVTGPLPEEDDRPVLKRIVERLERDGTLAELSHEDVASALETYRELDFLIATRLHSAILASCVHVPFVVYEYMGGKARGTVRDLGLPAWVVVENPEDLTDAVSRAWSERGALTAMIEHHLPKITVEIANATAGGFH